MIFKMNVAYSYSLDSLDSLDSFFAQSPAPCKGGGRIFEISAYRKDTCPIISQYEFLGKFSDPPFEIRALYDQF